MCSCSIPPGLCLLGLIHVVLSVAGSGSACKNGPGKYELVGFVSHMGSNTACGHYVAHVKKEGRWVIFNDDKVALSEHPPRDLGYMYMFKRL